MRVRVRIGGQSEGSFNTGTNESLVKDKEEMRRGECPCTVRGMRRKEAERCYSRRRPRPAKSVSQSVGKCVSK